MESKLKSKLEPIEVTLARRWADFRLRRGAWLARSALWAKGKRGPVAHSLLLLLCIGVVLNLINIAAPGYFGPDEHAMNVQSNQKEIGERITNPWKRFHKPRYTPIMHMLRGFLSLFLYETPVLFLFSSALFSILNGVLLYRLVLRFSGQARAALWAFLAFNLFPAAAFVAGWVAATDKLYMTCVLGIMHMLLSDRNAALALHPSGGWGRGLTRPEAWRQAGIALLFVLGLLSKEFAVVVPAAIAGLCLLVKPWRGWWWSLLITTLILGIYLAFRLDEMLDVPAHRDPLSLSYVPGHLQRYWLYPFVWDNLLLHDVLYAPAARLWLAGLLSSLPVLFLLLRNWRFALAYIGYYYVFVSPVMIGISSFPNYLYGAAPSVAVLFAYVFRRPTVLGATGRYAERGLVRACACGLLAVLALHSANLQWNFYQHGAMQQRTYTSVAVIVRNTDHRAGNEETKFAIVADSRRTWEVLHRSFWPRRYRPAENIVGLDLHRRVTVHHSWEGLFHEIPAGSVLLRITPEGYVVEE